MEYRIEKDTMGKVQVPAHVYWGAQTQRSLEHFAISGERMPDELIRALAEVKVEAYRMLLATHSALQADGALLSPGEHAQIEALMLSLRGIAANSVDAAAIEAATQALADGTEAFAAARMNAGIQKALAGKNVENF